MAWNDELRRIVDALAGLYQREQEARALVDRAGIPPEFVSFDSAPKVNWHNIVREANRRGLVKALVREALVDYPEDIALSQLGRALPHVRTITPQPLPVPPPPPDPTAGKPPSAAETRRDGGPWRDGSFYLIVFVIIFLMVGTTMAVLIQMGIPMAAAVGAAVALVLAGFGVVLLIGALHLSGDGRISEKSLIDLVKLGLRALLGRAKTP